jgi:protein-S-isoprenylcysteine O-methyltransferase Ste14
MPSSSGGTDIGRMDGDAGRAAKGFRLPLRALTGRVFLQRAFVALVFVALLVSSEGWKSRYSLVEESLYLAGVVLVALCLVGRAWSLSYIAGSKNKKLTTTGPYSLCRNPLYFSNFLGGVGLGFCTESVVFPILIAAVFAVYYPLVIRKEERKLQRVFGQEFEGYTRRVPRFVPSLKSFSEEERIVISTKSFRRGIVDLAAIVVLMGLIEVIESLHEAHVLTTYFTFY